MRSVRILAVHFLSVSVVLAVAACGGDKGGSDGGSVQCGAAGQACCSSTTCGAGLACQAGVCQSGTAACGAANQPCCTTGTTCTGALVCQTGTCGVVLTDSKTLKVCGSGATVQVNGAALTIPSGALKSCTTVKLSVTASSPAGYSLYSPVIAVEPAGLELATPATLSIQTSGAPSVATGFWSTSAGERYEPGPTTRTGDVLAVEIPRFGSGFVAGRDYMLVCPAGATLATSGATLTIPRGALPACSMVRLSRTAEAPTGYAPYSPVIQVTSDGKDDLAMPATLTVETASATAQATGFWSLPDGLFEASTGSLAGNLFTMQVPRLGKGFVAGRDYVRICAEGGTLTVPGATLTIPRGAFADCTMVSLSRSAESPRVYTPYSPIFSIATAGGVGFAAPVALSLDYSGDANRATMFQSRVGTTGYEPIAQALSSASMAVTLTRPGTVFVADGVDFVDLPDRSCVVTRKVDDGRTLTASSTVAVFYTADDCWGRPMPGLVAGDFSLRENGTAIPSTEASATILSQKGEEVFVSLVIDLSASTLPRLADVIAGAQSFVTDLQVTKHLPVRVGVELFDGRTRLVDYQKFTLDHDAVIASLKALKDYDPASDDPANPANATAPFPAPPADPASTNLNGAVEEGLASLASAESTFRGLSSDGAFTVGYLVLFTDGSDTAHRVPFDEVAAQVAASNDTVVAVGLQSAEYREDTLKALATGGVITAQGPAQLSTAFAALGNRITLQLQRFYLLGYCSPSRQGKENVVQVGVVGAKMNASASYVFDASAFGPGCSTSTIAHLCDGMQCGGLGCGFCAEGLTCSGATTGLCR